MKLRSRNRVILQGPGGAVHITRNRHGIPEIRGEGHADLAFGLGWVHACDRQLQLLLSRTLLQGRAAELLRGDPVLVEVDRYMRRLNFLPDASAQESRLEPFSRALLEAYAAGVNFYFSRNRPVPELRLLGFSFEPWRVADSLLIGKAFGYVSLTDALEAMEKFIVQAVHQGLPEEKLRELFPPVTEPVDYGLFRQITLAPPLVPGAVAWLNTLPRFSASNNWAVSGARTASGKPIFCNDPHLEVNRLPAVWQEIVMRLPGDDLIGAGIPGVPGLVLGRTRRLAWGATYSFMDTIDYLIEHCREGCYRRGDRWIPFTVREETIRVKKGAPVVEKYYESEYGVLEGDPHREGYYLAMYWSGARGCGAGDFNGLLALPLQEDVPGLQGCFRKLEAASFNWVCADAAGNIGYQMSGLLPRRPAGASGLLPRPAWEETTLPGSFADPAELPALLNPPEGYIVTANNDLNHLGRVRAITLPMAPHRASRITALLQSRDKLAAADMQEFQQDLYSLQAEAFMEVLRPFLPNTGKGRLLQEWDLRYTVESRAATLFEAFYLELVRLVIGDGGLGREVVDFILKETGLFNDFYGHLDRILLADESAWFGGHSREDLFRQALAQGLEAEAVPYGETRQVMLAHLLLGGKLPRFLGFDRGPVALPGCRATVVQGQVFKNPHGGVTTFSPSYRLIADLAGSSLLTNIAGGSSDRRFSRWYASELRRWISGSYKELR